MEDILGEIRKHVEDHGLDSAVEHYAAIFNQGNGEPAGIWLRVSTGGQDEINQLPDVLRLVMARGYRAVKWYQVHDKSASKGEQQAALDEMVSDVRDGTIKVLATWHSDRLERRGPEAALKMLREVRDAGGHFAVEQEPYFGEQDLASQGMTLFSALTSQQKSVHLSKQVKLSHNRSRSNNAVISNVPWGWVIAGPKYNKKPVPTAECCKYVPQIYAQCIQGKSLHDIAVWLDAEGVKTLKGGKWDESVVRKLIRKRIYAGRYLDPNGRTICTCEAIVDAITWQRANKALRDRPYYRLPQSGNRPLLATLKCPRCGSPMYRITAGTTKKSYYYRCFGAGPQRKGCGNLVSKQLVEDMVVKQIAANEEPHQIKTWVDGKNWDVEIDEIQQDLQELMQDILMDGAMERIAAKRAELADYTERNQRREAGHFEYIDVVFDNGRVLSKGEYFYDLYELEGDNQESARDYLMEFDITAEKLTCCKGIRLTIDGRETVGHDSTCG